MVVSDNYEATRGEPVRLVDVNGWYCSIYIPR
jgi:hypothetical protein